MAEEWILGAALAVLALDCALFVAVVITVRRGISVIRDKLTELLMEPGALAEIGRGFAAGMRDSAHGAQGATKADENRMLGDLLESWMTRNTPMLKMIEEQIPDIRNIVRKHPAAAFALLQRLGPVAEQKIGGFMDKAVNQIGQGLMK